VHGVHKENLVLVQREEECQGETIIELLNTLDEDLCKEYVGLLRGGGGGVNQ
jgi:hypothetical protein